MKRSPPRSTLRLLASALAVALVSAVSASAGTWQFQATYGLRGFGSPAPVGTGTGLATVSASGGLHVASLQIPGGLATIQSTTTPTGTSPAYTRLIVSMTPGSGTFAGGSGTGTLAGALPVPGNVRVCLLGGCLFAVDVPFTENGTRGVGLGGTVTAPTGVGTGVVSIVGAGWSTATATVSSTQGLVTSMGFAHGPLSNTSSTLQTDGVLQLVTPAQVNFVLGTTTLPLPVIASLEVRFLPEPGALGGLLAGAAALAWQGARRGRRR